MEKYFDVVVEVLSTARRAFNTVQRSEAKGERRGVGAFGDVTYEFDRFVEKAVLDTLRRRYPDSLIISEEAGVSGSRDGKPVVLLDPLDGSTNALHGVPICSTAIAVAEGPCFKDIVTAGVVDLYQGDMILAIRGSPVLMNGRPVQPSNTTELNKAYVSIDIKIRRREAEPKIRYQEILCLIEHVRTLGSAALETAYVAGGRIDAFVAPLPQLRLFDCLPSLFLITCAGGFIKVFGVKLDSLSLLEDRRLSYVAACTKKLGLAIVKSLL